MPHRELGVKAARQALQAHAALRRWQRCQRGQEVRATGAGGGLCIEAEEARGAAVELRCLREPGADLVWGRGDAGEKDQARAAHVAVGAQLLSLRGGCWQLRWSQ